MLPALHRSGMPVLDAEFRRREEQLVQDMSRDFSEFSVTGLGWLEERAQSEAAFLAERAAEDAEVARRRFEEDAARAAHRSQVDSDRRQEEQHGDDRWIAEREVPSLPTLLHRPQHPRGVV